MNMKHSKIESDFESLSGLINHWVFLLSFIIYYILIL